MLQDSLPASLGCIRQGFCPSRSIWVSLSTSKPERRGQGDQVEGTGVSTNWMVVSSSVESMRVGQYSPRTRLYSSQASRCQLHPANRDDLCPWWVIVAEQHFGKLFSIPGWERGPHRSIALRRVLVAIPLRSLNSIVGSMEIVITAPG